MSRRKSEDEHILSGTVVRPTVEQSRIKASRPKPPEFLSDEAKQKFKQLAKQLAARRACTAGDGDLIAVYCSCWERWIRALTHLRDEGDICKYTRLGADGMPVEVEKENLHVKLAQNCERQQVTILKQLGLTPKEKDAVRPTAPRKLAASVQQEEGYVLPRSETTLPELEIDLSTIGVNS